MRPCEDKWNTYTARTDENSCRGQESTKLYNPFIKYPRRDPNAMDTSADRGRIRLAGAEDILHNEGYQREQQRRSTQMDQRLNISPAGPPPRPPFPPHQGYFQQQRERRDMTKVQCFNCQGYRSHQSLLHPGARAKKDVETSRDIASEGPRHRRRKGLPPSNEPTPGCEE
jgi:hypothetical protein